MWKAIGSIVVLVGLLAGATLLRPKVTRAAIGIAADEVTRCEAPKLPVYVRPGYDRRVAANDYLEYAVAVLNVYPDGEPKGFALAKHSPEWRRVERVDAKGGLAIDVYHRDEPGVLRVLTVFRGTDSLDAADWAANFSWAIGWLPITTQYDGARLEAARIRKAAYAAANGRKVSFIASGHSLGGGLAQHVAAAFPCTGAVVFNSSFVTNVYRLARPFTDSLTIHVFEDLDEMTRLRRLLFVDRESATYKHYRQDAVNDRKEFQHTMQGLAIGMARQVLRCQEKRAECPVPATSTRPKQLYCSSWGVKTVLCTAG